LAAARRRRAAGRHPLVVTDTESRREAASARYVIDRYSAAFRIAAAVWVASK
jgi:hypothetical protein